MAAFLSVGPVGSRASACFFWTLVAGVLVAITRGALAEQQPPDTEQGVSSETFAVHGQLTYVEQETSRFNAPYS
ncbi:MAG: hypothetical protein ACREU6_13585, partial [Steroidobacteraceae bacterium]